jgi:hypothetical protein
MLIYVPTVYVKQLPCEGFMGAFTSARSDGSFIEWFPLLLVYTARSWGAAPPCFHPWPAANDFGLMPLNASMLPLDQWAIAVGREGGPLCLAPPGPTSFVV